MKTKTQKPISWISEQLKITGKYIIKTSLYICYYKHDLNVRICAQLIMMQMGESRGSIKTEYFYDYVHVIPSMITFVNTYQNDTIY